MTTIPAAQHFRAIAYLRWCLFRNGFRRKGGKGELIARVLVYPIGFILLLGPVLGAFFTALFAAREHQLAYLLPIFTVIFVLQIIVSINISAPGLSFDPESLIRFPLSFPRYLVIRLFLGLLSASTIVGTCALLAAALGIAIAIPHLALIAFAAALLLAIANMLFVRMVFAWVDRWLSTRRAREIFTVLIFAGSLGFQYLNVTYNNVGHRSTHAQQTARFQQAAGVYQHGMPVFMRLPPGLAASSILAAQAGHPTASLLDLLGLVFSAAIFLAIFAWRMHREYRGENLSEAGARPPTPLSPTHSPELSNPANALPSAQILQPARPSALSPAILACLHKEWLYVRRNTSQFYALAAPLAMVFILAGRLGSLSRTGFVFPIAAAYCILGVSTLAYNVLGIDGPGVQFYFLAPVPLRSVMLAKNIFGFFISTLQILLLYVVLSFTSGVPGLWITLSTLSWFLFAILVNATVGNMRSLIAPKKVDPTKLSRKQASQLSALLALGLMLTISALGAGLVFAARAVALPWLPVPILLALAAGALALYLAGLHRIDAVALAHRETLLEELTKVSV